MTIVAAIRDPGKRCTWLGSDSRVTMGQTSILLTAAKKWRVEGRYAIASSGWTRGNDLVRGARDLFAGVPDIDELANRLLRLIKNDEWRSAGTDGPFSAGASFLVVIGSEIYDVDASLAVNRVDDGALWARGSGMDYALGAAVALAERAPPYERLVEALRAACILDSGCAPPLVVQFVAWEG